MDSGPTDSGARDSGTTMTVVGPGETVRVALVVSVSPRATLTLMVTLSPAFSEPDDELTATTAGVVML